MKYFLYNDTNANPWGYGGYGSYIELVKKRYREALELLKKLWMINAIEEADILEAHYTTVEMVQPLIKKQSDMFA